MKKRYLISWFIVSLAFILGSLATYPRAGFALEKLKFATSLKKAVHQGLLILAAEEKGFWRKNGLDTEWVPFRGGAAMVRAIAARSINIGLSSAGTEIRSATRGVPVIIIANMKTPNNFFIWVRADSRIRKPKDLRGAKIGITRFGGVADAYGRVVTKALGFPRNVTFVAAGGIAPSLAALQSGAVDAVVNTNFVMAPLKIGKKAREVVAVRNFFPKEWVNDTIFGRKDFLKKKPSVARGAVRAILQSAGFVMKNRRWSLEKMESFFKYSDAAARFVYDQALHYGTDGKIDRRGIENVKNFMVDFGIVPKGKVPPLDDLYTNEFTG